MSDPTVPRTSPRSRPALPRRLGLASSLVPSLLLVGALSSGTGCHGSRTSRAPGAAAYLAAGWIDDATIGEPTLADPERLAALASVEAGVEGRLLRLDRLLDLYDGARFAGDATARESLWLALGGYATTRGIDASREVVIRLLDEAYALEDAATSEDQQRFVADAIMLLSADMFLPDSAEALISQTLAYRVLAEAGHPRVADNAHWRLYDHVRGVLAGTVEVGPALRSDVAVHALYANREDISAWLDDLAPHAQPPLPSADELWGLLEAQRSALAALPRWQPVLAARSTTDAELRETVVELLPRPRDPAWELTALPQGTGARESLAPVVLLADGQRVLAPTGPAPQPYPADDRSDAGVAALEGLVIRDGRGLVLLAAAAQAPAPGFAATLASLRAAKVGIIELAAHEPRIGEREDGIEVPAAVVVALPLHVVPNDDRDAGARAFREARIRVQLGGRGPRFSVDGRWLTAAPALPTDVARLAGELRRAYPGERAIALSLAADVQPGQLVDLLATLTGGRDPLFLATGWLPDAVVEAQPVGDPAADEILTARLGLVDMAPAWTLPDPAGLSEDDRVRVGQARERLRACVPELEAPLGKAGLELELVFTAHKFSEASVRGRKLPEPAKQRIDACARDRLLGLRLDPDESDADRRTLVLHLGPA